MQPACGLQAMVQLRNRDDSVGGRGLIQLAPGIALHSEGKPLPVLLMAVTADKVHLNQHALAIIKLCDGSRTRDRVVTDAVLRSAGGMRGADVVDFLDAAQARGWLIESE